MEIYFCTTSNSVTLYWEKPDEARAEESYCIYKQGVFVREVSRTHCTISDLRPETTYTFAVWMGTQMLGSRTVQTQRVRIRRSVIEFGVVGDGKTLNTVAIQNAIDAITDVEELVFPAGTYLTGALQLHSGFVLCLEENAVLQGTAQPEDYLPRIPSRFEGIERECYSSLLNLGIMDHASGPNCKDVLIYGKGTIAGGGRLLADRIIENERLQLKEYLEANAELVGSCENDRTIPGRVRPRLIHMCNCENVRISGLTLRDGASWNVHMIYSNQIITDHCTFLSKGVWNGDGWDPDSSTNCTLFACCFQTEDDAIAIKSGKNPEGNIIARPSGGIRIFDCSSQHSNGLCIGSEISGGVEDVRVWDCDFSHSRYGLEVKGTKKRGGYVRNIQIRDCIFPRVMIHEVDYNDDGVPAKSPPVMEAFQFKRLRLTGGRDFGEYQNGEIAPVEISGFSVPDYEIRNVRFTDCEISQTNAGIILRNCKQVTFDNLNP